MEKEIGEVSTFFSHVDVAAVKLSGTLKIGQRVRFKGNTTNFEQEVDSIQIDRKDVGEAKKGSHVGIKIAEKVRPHDKVFLIE
jgi:putative protease